MLFIFICLLILFIIVFKKTRSEKFSVISPKFNSNKWWDSNKNCENKNDNVVQESLNLIVDQCKTKPNHYIETSKDNYDSISLQKQNDANVLSLNKIKLDYEDQENIVKEYGTYKLKGEAPNTDKSPLERNYVGEVSVKDILFNPEENMKGYVGKKGVEGSYIKTIDQGKDINDMYKNSFDDTEGDNINGSNFNFVKDNINSLDDYYKFQILKKKNFVNHLNAEKNFITEAKRDERFIDKSKRSYYNGESYIKMPGYTEGGIEEVSNINKIGYSDLFGKPHIQQGPTDNLVSRSFHADVGEIHKVMKDGKCKGKYCCEEGEECYPTRVEEETGEVLPNLVSASCKSCPVGLVSSYEFVRPGEEPVKYFTNIGGFYTGAGIPGNNLNSNMGNREKDGYKNCKLCDYQAGCRYDINGNPRDTHFEAQACKNGNNRVCKPCRICMMGKEYTKSGCGEGGVEADTECAICSKCKNGTFKVAGCSNYNSFFDTFCVKSTDCKGKPIITDENDPNYYEDPGEGNRYYAEDDGYPGGNQFGGKGYVYGEGDSEIKGEELPNPYFGKDRTCKKCDTCPEGTKMIGDGCMGLNSKKNTICQRIIPVDKYVDKLQTCQEGKYFNRKLLREKLTYDFNAEKQSDKVDSRVINFYEKDKEIREKLIEEGKNPNDMTYYKENPIPEFSVDDIKKLACEECIKCDSGFYKNPKNGGCLGDTDTICIPKTKCKPYEIIESEGDHLTDRKCGPCKCPPDKFGVAVCEDNKIIDGCKTRKICSDGEYRYDNPVQYDNVVNNTICKKCNKCPPNSFKLADCKDSTDTVCKSHRVCGDKQYIVKKGTDISDTICKCIDGYELPKDEFGSPNLEASNCIPSKGKCWTNPCHPNAKCYDRFDDKGNFVEFVCRCNNDEGYIETELLGVGAQGCRKIPTKHSHDLLGLAPASDYGLSEEINQIMTHVDADYHRKLESKHLHKN